MMASVILKLVQWHSLSSIMFFLTDYFLIPGIPSPYISWWMDDQQLNAYTSLSDLRISSHLNLRSIPRSYNAKRLQCQVNIAGFSKVLKKEIRFNIYGT